MNMITLWNNILDEPCAKVKSFIIKMASKMTIDLKI